MNESFLRFYHALPGPARSSVATLWGAYLYCLRYGMSADDLVEQALDRDRWSSERWKRWQEERLAYCLHRAATRVPYYRELWSKRRKAGDRASWEDLQNWPILEKDEVRRQPERFVADDRERRWMWQDSTSGTTGTPLGLWFSRATIREWYALCEARSRRWYGVSRGDRWACLGRKLVVPPATRRPPFWVWNGAFKQLYMSSYHLAPDLIPRYLDALRRYDISYLLGYTASLYALAQGVLELGRRDVRMQVVITNAEPLFEHQRSVIAEAFQCPVRETYGMTELGAAASECEQGAMHLWPEVGWVEIVPDRDTLDEGEGGDLVCTGLLNLDMPLIRYRVGDRASRPPPGPLCSCGRLPFILRSVDGRSGDVLYTIDGRALSSNCVEVIFKPGVALREAQIIQESFDRVRLRVVPAAGFTEAMTGTLINGVRQRMGPVHVIVDLLDRIPREANGKFRVVISRLRATAKVSGTN